MFEALQHRDVILASSSPRRRELLTMLGVPFRIVRPDCEEPVWEKGDAPLDYVRKAAHCKTACVAEQFPDSVVLGADTAVICGDEVFGKPADETDAVRMLRALQGHTHQVATGVILMYDGKTDSRVVVSDVTFAPMSEEEIHAYLQTGEPFDKAGAYGIQGIAACWITSVCGDWSNVVGLPVSTVYSMLKGF